MAAKRELIGFHGDKRYVRRDANGHFTEVDDVGRSLTRDVRQKAKTVAKPGHGDRGDRRSSSLADKVGKALSSASKKTGAFKTKK